MRTTAGRPKCILQGRAGLVFLLGALSMRAVGQVELLSDASAQAFFGGSPRLLVARFRNPTDQPLEENLQFRLYQASASTLAPVAELKPWKTLRLSSRQTVLESVSVDLPDVRGETVFQLIWFSGEKKLGAIPVRAFPAELLKPLTTLAGDAPVGLLDPDGAWKAAFARVPTQELKEAEDILATESKLLVVAPVSASNRPAGLAGAIKAKAARGAAIVWIQASAQRAPDSLPDAYVVNESAGNVVVADPSTVNDLVHSPRSQQNLIRLAELATGHRKLDLPEDPPR